MEDKKYTVYIHTNKINNKVYIGITSGKAEHRWNNGKGYLVKNKNNKYHQPLMARAVLRYDWDNDWEHIIFAEGLLRQEASHMEQLLIMLYHSNDKEFGYNISSGGESAAGCKRSKEYIENMSKIRKGWIPSDEWRQKQSIAHQGKKLAKETKELLSKSKLGEQNPMFGKNGESHHNSIPVCQCDKAGNVINFYWNSCEAERYTGISFKNINAICNKYVTKSGYLRKTAGGFYWRHATQEEIYNQQEVAIC